MFVEVCCRFGVVSFVVKLIVGVNVDNVFVLFMDDVKLNGEVLYVFLCVVCLF